MIGNRQAKPLVRRCIRLKGLVPVSARQERIEGWDQARFENAHALIAGAGGLGGEVVGGLVQKGIGTVEVADFDVVTPSNLNRQPYSPRDLWKNKAIRLCIVMRRRGFLGSRIIAHPCSIQEVLP